MDDAACRERPDVDFFPGPGQPSAPAKAVCASCLVRRECFDYARQNHEVGVWGGQVFGPRRASRPSSAECQAALAADVASWRAQALAARARRTG
jgi:hypothetical protein